MIYANPENYRKERAELLDLAQQKRDENNADDLAHLQRMMAQLRRWRSEDLAEAGRIFEKLFAQVDP